MVDLLEMFPAAGSLVDAEGLGSARATRAGDDALVIADFFASRAGHSYQLTKFVAARAPQPAREARALPRKCGRPLSIQILRHRSADDRMLLYDWDNLIYTYGSPELFESALRPLGAGRVA